MTLKPYFYCHWYVLKPHIDLNRSQSADADLPLPPVDNDQVFAFSAFYLVATEDDHIRQAGPQRKHIVLGRHRDRQFLSEIRSKQQLHELEIDTRGDYSYLARDDPGVRQRRRLAEDSWSEFKSDRSFSSSIGRGAAQWGENDNPLQMNLDEELSKIEKALRGIYTKRRSENILEEPLEGDSERYETENTLIGRLRSKQCFVESMTTWGDTGTGRSLDWHDV
ncbi:hypothetical protein I204_01153 [Kwoniella mangroviensis CBS 8886]|nr:hypothetical protein I204_01153 [Kwoniella mangroviensis CBS 8886]